MTKKFEMLDGLFTIVISAIVLTVSFFVYKEYTNSRSYRVKKSVKNFRMAKKEEANSTLKYKNSYCNFSVYLHKIELDLCC